MLGRLTTALLLVIALTASAIAQELTSTEALELQLEPLRKAQIEGELDKWWTSLTTTVGDLAKKREEALGSSDTAITTAIDVLSARRDALIERFNVVIAALEAKGGDVEEARTYVGIITPADEGLDIKEPNVALEKLKDWATSTDGGIKWATKIGLVSLTLIAFKFISAILGRITRKAVSRINETSELLKDFFVNSVRKLTSFVGLMIGLSIIGIDIGPVLATMGALGFIIAFALQGTLSNFASGIMILLYRPYDLGDVIKVAGVTGKVGAMSLVSTTIKTLDNQVAIIPNNSIWGDVITTNIT